MATFFDVARNCVVHRASSELAASCAAQAFLKIARSLAKTSWEMESAPPPIKEGDIVDWRPRHAIMASDASGA
jgi:hypothetical protein